MFIKNIGCLRKMSLTGSLRNVRCQLSAPEKMDIFKFKILHIIGVI
ncbi:MAG: hypothetical protein K0S31_531 [Sphingobacterium multivorum]|jgi:hypothetical protein|nr:hypothetical protein [Sphingobacterium multivorum]